MSGLTRRNLLVGAAAVGALAATGPPRIAFTQTATGPAADLLDAFPAALPGYGLDEYLLDQPIVHEMALGSYLIACVRLGELNRAIIAGDQLLAMRHRLGAVGWGLGFRWGQTFHELAANPPEASYGITNAVCGHGLLDLYEATSDNKYLAAAVEAFDNYLTAFVPSSVAGESGFFCYSTEPGDYRTDVAILNVSAMLAGQYARLGTMLNRADYLDVAHRSVKYLWARVLQGEQGQYWPYRYPGSSPNDPVHAAFIVQGIYDHDRYLPPGGDLTSAVDWLAWRSRSLRERDRLWGVGQMMYTLADVGRPADAERVRDIILPQYAGPNHYVWRYGLGDTEDYVRHRAFLLAGLARIG